MVAKIRFRKISSKYGIQIPVETRIGTVVVHDVPDNATTVGNPNRVILK